MALQDSGGSIIAVAPFYVATPKKGKGGGANAKVVTPRHWGVPRAGWVASGSKLGAQMREHKAARSLVEMARIFTATTYDGALLLADLRQVRPDLAASATAVDKTLANYEHHLSIYTEASLAAPSTRLRSASVYRVVTAYYQLVV